MKIETVLVSIVYINGYNYNDLMEENKSNWGDFNMDRLMKVIKYKDFIKTIITNETPDVCGKISKANVIREVKILFGLPLRLAKDIVEDIMGEMGIF